MAFINSIGLANAPYKHAQSDIKTFALQQYGVSEKYVHRISRMYDNSMIEHRFSAIGDFTASNDKPVLLKSKTQEASTEDRMKIYFEIAPKMAIDAVRSILQQTDFKDLTHIITVSCTGLAAPVLDIILLQELQLPNNITRHSVNFMGCYAGFHALKMAKAICAEHATAKVLIVDVELCTLHFQNEFSMDNVASTLLFADGAAAIMVSNKKENSLFEINSFYTEVDLKGKKDMAWQLGPSGFKMTLSSYIPGIISENIQPLIQHAVGDSDTIKHWAIHPGGKNILMECARALNLNTGELSASFEILRYYGNMSSVTIFYVLKALQKKAHLSGDKIFAAGFGPGLTIESAILHFV